MNKQPSKYWKTSDLYLAAYLYAGGGIVVGIDADEHSAVFAFADSLENQNRRDEYFSGKPLVNARIFVSAIETLKHKAMDALIECHGR